MTEAEHRHSKRKRVLKGARILVPEFGISADCAVRDVSETGACLVLIAPVAITDTFDLSMHDNVIRRCRVVWRVGRRVGVAFG
jgi:hypothetical protein